jgi:hypothetical protein
MILEEQIMSREYSITHYVREDLTEQVERNLVDEKIDKSGFMYEMTKLGYSSYMIEQSFQRITAEIKKLEEQETSKGTSR